MATNIDGGEKVLLHQQNHDFPENSDSVWKQCSRARFQRTLLQVGAVVSLLLLYGVYHWQRIVSVATSDHKVVAYNRSPVRYTSHAEKIFLSVPSNESARAALRHYGTHPHLAGSAEDLQGAKDILAFFQKELGIAPPSTELIFDAGSPESREATLGITSARKQSSGWIDTYYPVMNTGNAAGISLSILGADSKPIWTADLLEDGDPRDDTAATYRDSVPPWHGLSASGEAIGQIVYVNYGTKEDYDKLVEAGVDFSDKIILARYGEIFRGLKIQRAEELGAAGVIIYTDPRDDGSVTVENGYLPYPAGPARNPTSIERGSVQYLSKYPGDPTTPGHPAYPNATRSSLDNTPTIPSIPLSWANAKILFEELGGIEEGRKTDGKLGIHQIRMTNDVHNRVIPIWNAMAAIPGLISDEVIIFGCHRDAWVMGAADPISGTVSLLEVVRGLGVLLRQGWTPLRTILIASWDAEEYGLIGSTEFGEDFADWIQAHVISYINVDVSACGSRWFASGSPSLAHLIKKSAEDVPHPMVADKTLWDARYDAGPYIGEQDADFSEMWAQKNKLLMSADRASAMIDPLGSGSDFTVFLQRLGIASADQGFRDTPTDPSYHYHSIYDSRKWQETYTDPGFHKHIAVAKSLGLITLRLANSIILPLNTTQYALELDTYVDTVAESAPDPDVLPNLVWLRRAISALQHASAKLDAERSAAEEAFFGALLKANRRRLSGPRTIDRIRLWVDRLLGTSSITEYSPFERALNTGNVWSILDDPEEWENICEVSPRGSICQLFEAVTNVRKINAKLRLFEQGFISEAGIKDREWYRHLGVAPGKYLGYGATTLPALTEAILYERNETSAKYEAARLTRLIWRLAKELEV